MTERDHDAAGAVDRLCILAGGRSSRFGRDKALEPFPSEPGRETLLARVLRRLAPLARRRVVVRAAPLADLPAGVEQFADPNPGGGPLVALASLFRARAAHRWFVAPCDSPWLEPELYARLVAELRDAPAAVAWCEGRCEPLVSLFAPSGASALAAIAEQSPRLALHAALAQLGARRVDFADRAPFRNVNTPAELALAECAT